MLSPVSTGFECIKFKLAVIAYYVHGSAPQYLSGQLQYVTVETWRPAALVDLDVRLSRLVTALLPDHDSGTVYMSTCSLLHHSHHFVRN